ncbi:conserved protein of unknown function [Hyphomicrobium sp. 1Nfss2.1]
MAKRDRKGKGGDATVEGDDSKAIGGDAGESVVEPGGGGGDASVQGDKSIAIGGPGGRGGIVPGGDGGDAVVTGDSSVYVGGQGGEGLQADGRGGRGGRSGFAVFQATLGQGNDDWPLDVGGFEYGRGGDGPCSPQYSARLTIVGRFVGKQLGIRVATAGVTNAPAAEAFCNRVNDYLAESGHSWRLRIVAACFEFYDI